MLSVQGRPFFGSADAALFDTNGEPICSLMPERAFTELTVDGLDVRAYFSVSKPANRPINAGVDGTAGSDPDVWVIGPAGP